MKILYLIDTLEAGGTEKSLLRIVSHLKTVDPVVCFLYSGNRLAHSFSDFGVKVVPLGLSGKYQYATAIYRTLGVIRGEHPHLIHTMLARASFVGRLAGRLSSVPVLSTFSNESYAQLRFDQLHGLHKAKLRCTQFLDRWTGRFATHFVANSETVKVSNCRALGTPTEKVTVIYRGRHPSEFVVQKHIGPQVNSTPIILNVGRLISQKGQSDLLRAISIVLRETPVRLLIAGEGPLRSSLSDLIQELCLSDAVTLLGYREDVAQLLSQADIFVFPSHYEGHPGSLVEAMFAGKPIVASDIAVHRETISHGKTGLLCHVRDPSHLACAIQWMIQNYAEADKMGDEARRDATNRFHIDKIVAQHEQLYEAIYQQWTSIRPI